MQVIGLVLLALEPVFSATPECPDLTSLPACSCSISTSTLGISCSLSMTDADVDTLVGTLIPPTAPMETLEIVNSPSVTQVPQNLAQFTSLKILGLSKNAITSANGNDFSIPALYLVDLSSNAITSISGSFVLSSQPATDKRGLTSINFSNNKIDSIPSDVSFSLTGDNVSVKFKNNSITSVNGDTLLLVATYGSEVDFSFNQISSLSGKFNLETTKQLSDLFLGSNTITFANNKLVTISPATFSVSSASFAMVDFSDNLLTSVDGNAFTLLAAKSSISLNLGSNQISSLIGNFNFKTTAADSAQAISVASVMLSNNTISSISPATFSSDAGYLSLDFSYNLMTSVNGDATLSLITAPNGIYLDVSSNRISSVSGNFNLKPTSAAAGALAALSFANNKITSISSATFSLIATSVELTFTNNSLTSVPAGKITLKDTSTTLQQGTLYSTGISLGLNENQISTLDANFVSINCAAFKTSSCQINLSKNKLQKLDQGALQPILQSFAAGGLNTTTAFINASSNPIDCSTVSSSVCYANFGWLVGDDKSAPYVKNAACSDGKSISAVNQASCLSPTPAPTTTTRKPFINKPALLEMLGLTWIHSIFHSIFSG